MAAREILSLPVHPGLYDGEIEKVARVVQAWGADRGSPA
jgi:dTDP-4-amino-4,6-dideoxygalactose transaminase